MSAIDLKSYGVKFKVAVRTRSNEVPTGMKGSTYLAVIPSGQKRSTVGSLPWPRVTAATLKIQTILAAQRPMLVF